jgi:hypothetical protein
MADLKKKLGTPPDKTEVKNNLLKPGPAEITQTKSAVSIYDGRTLRKQEHKVQFNTSITPKLKNEIAEIAYKLRVTYSEMLAEAFHLYKEKLIKDGKI